MKAGILRTCLHDPNDQSSRENISASTCINIYMFYDDVKRCVSLAENRNSCVSYIVENHDKFEIFFIAV